MKDKTNKNGSKKDIKGIVNDRAKDLADEMEPELETLRKAYLNYFAKLVQKSGSMLLATSTMFAVHMAMGALVMREYGAKAAKEARGEK